MNSAAKPNSRCSSANSSSTCACTETSSAEVGSSAISSSGLERERPGQAGALPLAAGELVREAVAVDARQLHRLEQLVDAAARGARVVARPCTTSGSATHSAMVSSGLKLDAGSWKTNPMSLAHRPERAAP